MTPHFCRLYITKPAHRLAWDEGRGPGQVTPGKPPTQQQGSGPGTELKAIFAKLGIKTCFGCAWMVAKMNRKGPQWCRENIETIADWLREQAKKRGWPFSRQAVKLLIRWAIHRSEKQEILAAEEDRRR